ncbi:MAG: hypothetical protein VB095_11765 [Anaerovorax sp.]|nr:hypothetical protein [Anaerovorax sp.]
MKKKWVTVLIATMLVVSFSVIAATAAGSPGSEDDPVVTKSYVDDKIASISQGGTSAATYKAISVEAGQTLLGKEGTEIILRSGEATALDNGTNGISDVTAGTDLWSGNAVAANHLLLVPREDGRGIKAKTIIWVMVRGGYSIQ